MLFTTDRSWPRRRAGTVACAPGARQDGRAAGSHWAGGQRASIETGGEWTTYRPGKHGSRDGPEGPEFFKVMREVCTAYARQRMWQVWERRILLQIMHLGNGTLEQKICVRSLPLKRYARSLKTSKCFAESYAQGYARVQLSHKNYVRRFWSRVNE